MEQGIGGRIVFRIEITPPELDDPSPPTTLPVPSLPPSSFPRQESEPLSHPPLVPGGIRRPYPEEERESVPSDDQSQITVPIQLIEPPIPQSVSKTIQSLVLPPIPAAPLRRERRRIRKVSKAIEQTSRSIQSKELVV